MRPLAATRGYVPAGRPPVPTALKILRGNPGKHRLNLREPKPAPSSLEPPAWLDAAAAAIWREEAPGLLRLGLLSRADRLMFALLCDRAAQYQVALEKSRNGILSEIRQLCGQFGMSPAARARLSTPAEDARTGRWSGRVKA